MDTGTIAVTYARALLEAAADKGILEEVLEEVNFFAGLLREDRSLRRFVENPRLERQAKRTALESALRGKVSDTFLNFLLVVVDKGRQIHLEEMLEGFQSLYDEEVGIVRAEAVSAVPLPEEELARLKDVMSGQLRKQVIVSSKVDPEILGGLVVRFSGMVADGSLRTSLEEVRSGLRSLKFGSELVHEN